MVANLRPPPTDVLERIAQSANRFTRLAAELALARLEFAGGGWVDPTIVRAGLDQLDDESWHRGLWTTGLEYWHQMTGNHWCLEAADTPTPDPDFHGQVKPIGEAATIDARARSSLAAGSHAAAVASFEEVRAVCLAGDSQPSTTETAARLNIAWALWDSGEGRSKWISYITGALCDVQPSSELVRLRTEHADFLDELAVAPDLSDRLARKLRQQVDAEDDTGSVVTMIDDRARHQRLWLSGLDLWRTVGRGEWDGTPADPAPALRHRKLGRLLAGRSSVLERGGRLALRLRQWRIASFLFALVRSTCAQMSPPLTTTEQAARLNLGRARLRRGLPDSAWRPCITSVLVEVGPSPEMAAIRASATTQNTWPATS
jgi:hypothetical protein